MRAKAFGNLKCLLLVLDVKHHIVVLSVGTVWLTTTGEKASPFKLTLIGGFDYHWATAFFAKANLFIRFYQIYVRSQKTTQTTHLVTVFYRGTN